MYWGYTDPTREDSYLVSGERDQTEFVLQKFWDDVQNIEQLVKHGHLTSQEDPLRPRGYLLSQMPPH